MEKHRLRLVIEHGSDRLVKELHWPVVPRIGEQFMIAPGFPDPFKTVIQVQHARKVHPGDPEIYYVLHFEAVSEAFFTKLADSAQLWNPM